MAEKDTGNGQAELIAVDTLTLEYDRVQAHLSIGGRCGSLDLARAMLVQALWEIEARLRTEHANRLMANAAERNRVGQLMDKLHFGGKAGG